MSTILFFLSLLALCGMLLSKIFEIKFRKAHFLSHLFIKGDKRIHRLFGIATSKYHYYRKIAHIFIFDFIPSYLYELLVKMKDYVSKKYYEVGDGFRGRITLKNNGSVSFFLERLSDDKWGDKVVSCRGSLTVKQPICNRQIGGSSPLLGSKEKLPLG